MAAEPLRLTAYPRPRLWPRGQEYVASSYLIGARHGEPEPDLAAIAAILSDAVTEVVCAGPPPSFLAEVEFREVADVRFLPGVTDNLARTAKEALLKAGLITQEQEVASARLCLLGSDHDGRALHNPLIEARFDAGREEFLASGPKPFSTEVRIEADLRPLRIDLGEAGEEELAMLSAEGIADPEGRRRGPLGLSGEDLLAIADHYRGLGRDASDIELETFAQSWSEHCSHRLFNASIDGITEGLFERYIARATKEILALPHKKGFCPSVFADNAGAIAFDDDWMVCDKVETHNSPSALEPYGGAMTGIVGVNRDCLGFGLGARPIANRFGFCFGPRAPGESLYRDRERRDPLLGPDAIARGVERGIEDGGNHSGIPTSQGFVIHDQRYRGKPLVFCGTVGLIPRVLPDGRAGHLKKACVGDRIIVAGGRVGLDGIHGATFSSRSLDAHSPAGAVQIGDPITQKRLSDCLVGELRDQGLYSAITDNGAGGLSSSVGEMARDTGGAEIHLDRVPLKYPGLAPWQIWISESQERMTLAVPESHAERVIGIFASRGVEAVDIGSFTDSGHLRLHYGDRLCGDIDLAFLHVGAPRKRLSSKAPAGDAASAQAPELGSADASRALQCIACDPSLDSREDLALAFDHEVQGGSLVKPLQGPGRVRGDATVVAPLAGSERALALSQALRPWLIERNPYAAATLAVDEAVRSLVAVGADPGRIALQDNFCWCSPEQPERLWQLSEAARGCYEAAIHFEAPYISGKDSMHNDFSGFDGEGSAVRISALPTLLISGLGIVPGPDHVQTMDFKAAGDQILLAGDADALAREGLGGSQLEAAIGERADEKPAWIPPSGNRLCCPDTLLEVHLLLGEGALASVTAVGRGGLAHALLRSARAGQLGASITWPSEEEAAALFCEAGGAFLLTVDPSLLSEVTAALPGCRQIGEVTRKRSLAWIPGGAEMDL